MEMKQLSKYLNTKSQWHPSLDFPETPYTDDIIRFLETHNYTFIENMNCITLSKEQIVQTLENTQKKNVYCIDYSYQHDKIYVIYLFNGGEISDDNVCISITTSKTGKVSTEYLAGSIIHGKAYIVNGLHDYKKVKDEIKKYFGWE